MFIIKIITNEFFLLTVTGILGILTGKVKIKNFKLGTSACLFVGLVIGYFIIDYIKGHNSLFNQTTIIKTTLINIIIKNHLISHNIFTLSLILFISAVGLIASKEIFIILKKYSIKFIILALIITLTGAVSSYLFISFFGLDKLYTNGIFTGALTSSPGFASALESSKHLSYQNKIGVGYSFGYIPGVLSVIFAMYLLPIIFKINIKKELHQFVNNISIEDKFVKNSKKNKNYTKDKMINEKNNYNKINEKNNKIKEENNYSKINNNNKSYNQSLENNFSIISYFLVISSGILIGVINFHIFSKDFKLGITGGVLIASLISGNIKPFLIFNFDFNKKILSFLKEIGLVLFLSTIGLNYGYSTFSSLTISNIYLILISTTVAFISIFTGFVIGRYVFKFNWIVLAGSICGGMTSTPGLGASIDATSTEHTITGYGATYPFALIFMVILTNLINQII